MIHYVAAPYLSLDDSIRQSRFHQIAAFTAHLQQHVGAVISPNIMHHLSHQCSPLDLSPDGLLLRNEPLIRASQVVVVAMLDGWRDNRLMRMEIDVAIAAGLTVMHGGYDYHDHFFLIRRHTDV